MENIKDLILNRNFKEPDEIQILKKYIKNTYNADCMIKINNSGITVSVGSSGLASVLQQETIKLKKLIGSNKTISINIKPV